MESVGATAIAGATEVAGNTTGAGEFSGATVTPEAMVKATIGALDVEIDPSWKTYIKSDKTHFGYNELIPVEFEGKLVLLTGKFLERFRQVPIDELISKSNSRIVLIESGDTKARDLTQPEKINSFLTSNSKKISGIGPIKELAKGGEGAVYCFDGTESVKKKQMGYEYEEPKYGSFVVKIPLAESMMVSALEESLIMGYYGLGDQKFTLSINEQK